MWFSKRGPGSDCCQRHIPRTNYHTITDWLQYRINLVHLSTSQIPKENQSCSQQSAWPSNHSQAQCLYHVPQYQWTGANKGNSPDKKNIKKHSVERQTWTLHQSSNIARFSVVKFKTSLLYIDQLELDQFMKIINMFRVVITTPEE